MIYSLQGNTPVITGHGHFIAENATIVGKVRLGSRVSIWFNAVLRGDNDWIEIGDDSNIQDGVILHTDDNIKLKVGQRVTVGHRAMLHGCRIGDDCLIGIGSTIMNGARIGANSIVGAHALVTEGAEFPDGVLILGAPARVTRLLTADDHAMIAAAAKSYVASAELFNSTMLPCEE